MTDALYRENSYLKTCTTRVTDVNDVGVELEASVFYPKGGGQLGDTGTLTTDSGDTLTITDTLKSDDGESQRHVIEGDHSLSVGDSVTLTLDWERRYTMMRYHSACHMLCAAVNAPVNGGSIQVDRARLDFDCPDGIDKVAVQKRMDELVAADAPMSTRWITNEELDASPDLVRTMAVKPPRNAKGTIRLVEFKDLDLQACGGTHVASTSEIGSIQVAKVENKGKQNRDAVESDRSRPTRPRNR